MSGTQTGPAVGLPLRPWGYVGLITVPLGVAALIVWYRTGGAIFFGDIDWYASALRALTSSAPLYDPSKLLPHPLERPVFFDQAPSTALLALVLLLPYGPWIWGFGIVVAVLCGLALITPRMGAGGVFLLAPLLLAWLPFTTVLAWANVNGLVFLLLAVALRYPRLAGAALGLAAAIKLLPVVAVAWLAGKRDWRGVVVAIAIPVVATAIVLIWKGPHTLVDFIILRMNQWTPDGSTRWGLTEVLGFPNVVVYAIGGLLALLAYLKRSFSLSVVAMLAASPALHVHYWTWLTVPLFAIWFPWIFARLRSRPPNGSLVVTSGSKDVLQRLF